MSAEEAIYQQPIGPEQRPDKQTADTEQHRQQSPTMDEATLRRMINKSINAAVDRIRNKG